jgi:hypothetical protein
MNMDETKHYSRLIIGVGGDETRLDLSRRLGADVTLNHLIIDPYDARFASALAVRFRN